MRNLVTHLASKTTNIFDFPLSNFFSFSNVFHLLSKLLEDAGYYTTKWRDLIKQPKESFKKCHQLRVGYHWKQLILINDTPLTILFITLVHPTKTYILFIYKSYLSNIICIITLLSIIISFI